MIKNLSITLVLFLALAMSWEMAAQYNESLRFILPSPSTIAAKLSEQRSRFLYHTLVTFQEMGGGFFLALAISFPLAWLMSYSKAICAVLQPIFVVTQCVPMIALAPIAVFWFGWSYTAIIVPTAIMVFFPLTMNIYQGFSSAPKQMLDFFRLHDATSWQVFCKLQLPWALPDIFTGLRIGVTYAAIGAVAGEWAGGQQGLGILMLESRRAADIGMMFGALICLTLLSLGCYASSMVLGNTFARRFKRVSSTVMTVLTALLLGLVNTGCQSSNAEEPGTDQTNLILDWLPNPNHIPLYVGLEKGYFREEGINLNLLKIAEPNDNIPYITSGQANLGLGYVSSTLLAISNQIPVKPIAVLIDKPLNAILYRKDADIRSIEDLNGKVIGYCVDGYHTRYLEAILSTVSVKPEKLCNASFDLVGMLATKQVDAVFGAYWNIEGENLRFHSIDTEYFSLEKFGVPSHYELIVLALEGSPEASPEFTEAFRRAMQSSIDFAKENPQEAFSIYVSANPDKSAETREWELAAWYRTLEALPSTQEMNEKLWYDFINWLVDKNLLPKTMLR